MNLSAPAPALDLSKYIDTHFFGKRPHVRGRRVPVATIAHNHRDNGWEVERLAYEFSLNVPQVLAALLYYEEHSEAIEALEAAHQAALQAMQREHGGA
jgi:uncharacterized protein (DUF433 family)